MFYLGTFIGSITSAFSLKILGQKEQGGIIKVMAVFDMVLNFLITDKSVMAEKSSVPDCQDATDWTNVVNEQNFSLKSMTN